MNPNQGFINADGLRALISQTDNGRSIGLFEANLGDESWIEMSRCRFVSVSSPRNRYWMH